MTGALDGLVVLDLTTHLSGPFCGMQLGDLGADVIKIESPQGDSMRGVPPFVEGESAPFMLWNRNKRGVRLDLKNADDLEVFWGLVDGADVMLENFRPGVIDRLGIGWQAVHARNPRLVLGSISGFGQTGPYASRGGFDLVIQAMSGLMSVTGPKDGPPYRIPLAISDVGAGLYLTIGVLSALQARQKTGEGQWVETSLLEATVSLGVYEAANYFANGRRPERLGQGHRGSSPYQVFQTADGWITLGAAQQNFFRKVCALIGKPELPDDPRFTTNALRVKNNDAIVAILQAEIAKRSTADWMTALEAEGVPAGPVLHHDEVFADPQILARSMVTEIEHAKAGRQKTLGVPIKMSASPGGVRRAAPTLGQHDAELKKAKPRKKGMAAGG
jgi:crotonobetainyl-CoA:carnitine CoA-transferase CaiB-like acyl-CoA transferase